MAKISHREKTLLGYSCDSLLNSSSRRSSEVDFSDVFGGPPRCMSQEYYQNEFDINDLIDDEESADGLRSSWSEIREKPVFGEDIGVRKRYPSQDFYGDIFGGNQPLVSCSLSPRVQMPGRNPFSSAPGSRIMSPSKKPLSSATEPCASPSKFSLPGRIANTDVKTSTSLNQNSMSFEHYRSRFNQTVNNQSPSRTDVNSSYQASGLSGQISITGNEPTSDYKFNGIIYDAKFSIDSKVSENSNDNVEFHFSIYKWASKGVPFAMSSRKRSPLGSKGSITSERYLSTIERIDNDHLAMKCCKGDVIVNDSLSPNKHRMPSTSQVRKREHYNDTIPREKSIECQSEDDISQKVLKPGILTSTVNVPAKISELPSSGLKGMQGGLDLSQESSNIAVDIHPPKEGDKIPVVEKKESKSMIDETKKTCLGDVFPISESKQNKVHESFNGAQDDLYNSEVTRKVMDFVKIFNQDSSSKVKSNGVGQTRNWRWKDTTKFEAKNEFKTTSTKADDEMEANSVNLGVTLSDSAELNNGESFILGEQQYIINDNGGDFGTTSSASTKEPNIERVKSSRPKLNTTSEDNLGKGMVQDIDAQSTIEQNENQSYERKVLQWSKGKEGNIRALLSTMQYVLWPNSGWKPIPLVDIIEANSVKRAYQRALLCLHPDKLQQKGAAPYQKFIAEKVFDILQEAWDEFNSLGLV